MLPLGALIALLARQLGRILNIAFAWATTALFGRVPRNKRLYLTGMALGSLAWPVVLAGVVSPSVATFLLAFVTVPEWLEPWLRPAMIFLAVVIPLVVGLLASRLHHPPPTGRALVIAALRGYQTALGLSVVLLWMLVLGPVAKLAAIVRRHGSEHVAIATRPGAYDVVVRDVAAALGRAGIAVEPRRAHWAFELPGRVLAAIGGPRVRRLVPARLMTLRGDEFSVVVHPMDLALSGRKGTVARARAALARELMFTEAYQTWTKEAQDVEDALAAAARGEQDLDAIGDRLERAELEYDEWEILYRLLLQVRLHRMASDSGPRRDVGSRAS